MKSIPYSRQHINEYDIRAVTDVLKSDFLTCGPAIAEFENSIKNFCGAQNAVAIANGTAALHIALLALDVGEGDIVWTSPISFVASANCALYVKANIDFVDCDISTGNMDINLLEEKLKQAAQKSKLPKALVIVHFTGRTCDMEKVNALAKQYEFFVIEDAAHALGAKYKDGSYVGNCKYSDATTFSFHPVKSIAAGEGGMITTKDAKLAERMRLFLSHGITRNEALMEGDSQGAWYYQQLTLGYNFRITDIQCALGNSQVKRLQEFIDARKSLASNYNKALQNLSLDLPEYDENSAWHLYIIQIKEETKISRLELFNYLRDSNIGVNVHYIPIHTQPYYRRLGFKEGDFPAAENFYARAISIPLFPALTKEEQDYVIQKLQGALL